MQSGCCWSRSQDGAHVHIVQNVLDQMEFCPEALGELKALLEDSESPGAAQLQWGDEEEPAPRDAVCIMEWTTLSKARARKLHRKSSLSSGNMDKPVVCK